MPCTPMASRCCQAAQHAASRDGARVSCSTMAGLCRRPSSLSRLQSSSRPSSGHSPSCSAMRSRVCTTWSPARRMPRRARQSASRSLRLRRCVRRWYLYLTTRAPSGGPSVRRASSAASARCCCCARVGPRTPMGTMRAGRREAGVGGCAAEAPQTRRLRVVAARSWRLRRLKMFDLGRGLSAQASRSGTPLREWISRTAVERSCSRPR
mmetsp:Transcript_25744/g.63903  ORF Transcript_25744/g.63903 Transcript_25744/m.63903 type:complete len:209 (-) Transcript_25744:84-710(-)